MLTQIENKTKINKFLAKDELIFLYEINSKIEGFGYQRDPRIDELRKTRNPKEDAPTVIDCKPDQIAWRQGDITNNTKAYIGPLFLNIFEKLPGTIEHIYTSFPEGKIVRDRVEIGGQDKDQLQQELKKQKINVNDYAKSMMESKDFTTLEKEEPIELVRLKVKDLGLGNNPTTDQIYGRAGELGLELCPAEVGPHYRLKYLDQLMGEWIYIGMKQISARDGYPYVFSLVRFGDGLWLCYYWAEPMSEWDSRYGVVFARRKH